MVEIQSNYMRGSWFGLGFGWEQLCLCADEGEPVFWTQQHAHVKLFLLKWVVNITFPTGKKIEKYYEESPDTYIETEEEKERNLLEARLQASWKSLRNTQEGK
jgi:hypothetical protein